MDPRELVTREGLATQPPSLEDTIIRHGASSTVSASGVQGHRFSREFASVGEFWFFARMEMAGPDTSLLLVENNLSARELELAAWEENILAREMR